MGTESVASSCLQISPLLLPTPQLRTCLLRHPPLVLTDSFSLFFLSRIFVFESRFRVYRLGLTPTMQMGTVTLLLEYDPAFLLRIAGINSYHRHFQLLIHRLYL